MTQEEKAKRYDDLLVKLQKAKTDNNVCDDRYCCVIDDIVPELKESEDEKIRKALKQYFVNSFQNNGVAAICGVHIKDVLAWLEKQEQHKKFRDSIQVGDKVTKNEDGVLVNLSQLKRVAKKDENQGEQKPAWSDEDENRINRLIAYFEDKESFTAEDDVVYANWLKSLRPPYYCDNCKLKKSIQGWKPSDEQMEALKDALNDAIWQYDFKSSPIKEEVTRKHAETIESLYNDLEKLREE